MQKGHEEKVRAIFEKWDLHAEIVGEVIDEDRLYISYQGKARCRVPPETLVLGGGAPVYIREAVRPEYLDTVNVLDLASIPEPSDPGAVLLALMGDAGHRLQALGVRAVRQHGAHE